MNDRSVKLALRQGALRERIAAQRKDLVGHTGPLERALGTADNALLGVEWLKEHPATVGVAVALVVAASPKRVWRWSKRSYIVLARLAGGAEFAPRRQSTAPRRKYPWGASNGLALIYAGLAPLTFHGATLNSRSIPGTASAEHNQKKLVDPSISTSQPAEALTKVRGTAARLVNNAICVAV